MPDPIINRPLHLAQINVARLTHGPHDRRSAGFMHNLDTINALAERSPGFVWRLKDDSGNATAIQGYDDPNIIINMSVWRDAECFERFVWQTTHQKFYANRRKWFDVSTQPHLAMWWIEPGLVPELQDGIHRLEFLRRNGPSEQAFDWESLPNVTMWKGARCA
jgi:uncharacterized protein DUF3291